MKSSITNKGKTIEDEEKEKLKKKKSERWKIQKKAMKKKKNDEGKKVNKQWKKLEVNFPHINQGTTISPFPPPRLVLKHSEEYTIQPYTFLPVLFPLSSHSLPR